MESTVNEKQALMIALAIITKEKDITEYGHSALRESGQVLQKMLDDKTKTPHFKPLRAKESVKQQFKEMTIAEFEKQELAKSTVRLTKREVEDA
jgi:hypothetical protein|tara:strand:+ start:768 stop:1049 length:282 start_codon:yes stop_codon:yes gene_type:complete